MNNSDIYAKINDNLKQCCLELKAWDNTGMLPIGICREISLLIKARYGEEYRLSLLRTFVADCAINYVIMHENN